MFASQNFLWFSLLSLSEAGLRITDPDFSQLWEGVKDGSFAKTGKEETGPQSSRKDRLWEGRQMPNKDRAGTRMGWS